VRIHLLLIGILIAFLAHSQDTLTVDRLDYRFVSYEDGLMEPIISLEDVDVAGVLVPCDEGIQVEFCGVNPFDIWVDGRLILQKKKGSECEYFSLEKLCQLAGRDTVFLSVVSQNNLKGISARTFQIRTSRQSAFEILRRKKISEFLYFGFIGCFVFLVILKSSLPRGKMMLRVPNLQAFTGRFLTIDHLVIQLVTLLLTGFSYAILEEDANVYDWLSTFFFLSISWAAFMLITFLSASVFNFTKLMNWQLIFTIQYWFGLSVLVFVLQFIDHIFFAGFLLSDQFLIYTVVSFLFLFTAIVIYTFMTQRGMKSLHIFIYLCSTEILPISLVIYRLLE
jgi:hypothetical protein